MSYDATQRDLLSYTSQVAGYEGSSPEGVLISSLRNSSLYMNDLKKIFSDHNFLFSEKYLKSLIHAINDSFKEKCSSHLIVVDSAGLYFLRSWLL